MGDELVLLGSLPESANDLHDGKLVTGGLIFFSQTFRDSTAPVEVNKNCN